MSNLINIYRQLATVAPIDPFAEGFIFTVDVSKATGNGVNVFQIGAWAGTSYNYDVDWGDGTTNENVTSTITHNYSAGGIKTIRIVGQYPRISLGVLATSDAGKLLTIEQWGNVVFNSFDSVFRSAGKVRLNTAESPIIQGANVSFNRAFQAANAWFSNGFDMNNWDMSSVSDLFSCVFSVPLGNARFDGWDVRNVTNADFFSNTPISTVNYDLMLNAWSNLQLKNNVIFNPSTQTKYSSAGATARQFIIDTYGWTFKDGGQI